MNKLTNRNPFADFDNLFRTVERNLESAWHGTTKSPAGPNMDIYEKADALYIRAALPGVHEEDLELITDRKVVTIKGVFRCEYEEEGTKVYLLETPYGTFNRSIRLPDNCDSEAVEASLEHGVLTVRIPKIDKTAEVKRIPIRQKISTPSEETTSEPKLLEQSVA